MNWLAHLVLSDPTPEFRVGNVLADILPIGELRELPEPFQAGIARHRAIDAFTDSHPIFKQSVARLDPKYRRFGGVLMDIFYDHLLTTSWHDHVDLGIREFVESFHDDVERVRLDIPPGAYGILQRMRVGEWLTSYGDVDGVRVTLDRMSRRLRRPIDLGSAAEELRAHYEPFREDFATFFPLIRSEFNR